MMSAALHRRVDKLEADQGGIKPLKTPVTGVEVRELAENYRQEVNGLSDVELEYLAASEPVNPDVPNPYQIQLDSRISKRRFPGEKEAFLKQRMAELEAINIAKGGAG